MKNSRTIAARNINSCRLSSALAAGFFYACKLKIHGLVPPCGSVMRPQPLHEWCYATGKAKPFIFFSHQGHSYMRNKNGICPGAKHSTTPTAQAERNTVIDVATNFCKAAPLAHFLHINQELLRHYLSSPNPVLENAEPGYKAEVLHAVHTQNLLLADLQQAIANPKTTEV